MKNDNEPTPSTDDPKPEAGNGRRKLVKGIAAGGGIVTGARFMPGEWSKPVVESVVLPAHAQATPGDEPTVQAFTGTVAVVTVGGLTGIGSAIMDFVIPRAEAGKQLNPCPTSLPSEICIELELDEDGNGTVKVFYDGGVGEGTVTGNSFSGVTVNGTTNTGATFTVSGTKSGSNISGMVTAPCEDIGGPKGKDEAMGEYSADLEEGIACADVT